MAFLRKEHHGDGICLSRHGRPSCDFAHVVRADCVFLALRIWFAGTRSSAEDADAGDVCRMARKLGG